MGRTVTWATTDHIGGIPLLRPDHSRADWNRAAERCVILWNEYIPPRSGRDGSVPENIAGTIELIIGANVAKHHHEVSDNIAKTFGGK